MQCGINSRIINKLQCSGYFYWVQTAIAKGEVGVVRLQWFSGCLSVVVVQWVSQGTGTGRGLTGCCCRPLASLSRLLSPSASARAIEGGFDGTTPAAPSHPPLSLSLYHSSTASTHTRGSQKRDSSHEEATRKLGQQQFGSKSIMRRRAVSPRNIWGQQK